MSQLNCHVEHCADGFCLVALTGSADIDAHERLKKMLAPVRETKCSKVIVDLAKLEFLTSLAIGELISLRRSLRDRQVEMAVCAPNSYIESVFSKVRFSNAVPVYPSIANARLGFSDAT
ncbi:MAG: STAS domain-containing protein [Phycisphaeraceae bacterium]|nr:STAS domain-containing protein [Phycisphaeraceae bacterium]